MLKKPLFEKEGLLKRLFANSSDFYMKRVEIGGIQCCIALCDGQASLEKFWSAILVPIMAEDRRFKSSDKLVNHLYEHTELPFAAQTVEDEKQLFTMLTAGFAVLMVDGVAPALGFAAQQKISRAVGEPSGEGNIRGSREGFVEVLQVNMALVRRRVRSEKLRIETMTLGGETKTDIALFYMQGTVPSEMLHKTKERLSQIELDAVFDAGYLAPYLKKGNLSLFSGMGYTERPDTLAAKICEGKIGILVDGSPFALIIPYFFTENFHSMDDYSTNPYFASFIRVVKYAAFFMSILLPGMFVSMVNYTPQIVPVELLLGIMQSAQKTPLPLFAEALLVIFILEIVREAGLRMPKPLGHSLALLAALIVGDAAVQTGLITSVSLVVMALTSVSTFTVPALYEATTVLRILFVLAGGFFGPVGIALGFALLLFNLTAVNVMGIAYTAPLSPFTKGALEDGILRASLKKLEKNHFTLRKLPRAAVQDGECDE